MCKVAGLLAWAVGFLAGSTQRPLNLKHTGAGLVALAPPDALGSPVTGWLAPPVGCPPAFGAAFEAPLAAEEAPVTVRVPVEGPLLGAATEAPGEDWFADCVPEGVASCPQPATGIATAARTVRMCVILVRLTFGLP